MKNLKDYLKSQNNKVKTAWEPKPEENQDDIKPIEKEEEENNQSNEDE